MQTVRLGPLSCRQWFACLGLWVRWAARAAGFGISGLCSSSEVRGPLVTVVVASGYLQSASVWTEPHWLLNRFLGPLCISPTFHGCLR